MKIYQYIMIRNIIQVKYCKLPNKDSIGTYKRLLNHKRPAEHADIEHGILCKSSKGKFYLQTRGTLYSKWYHSKESSSIGELEFDRNWL